MIHDAEKKRNSNLLPSSNNALEIRLPFAYHLMNVMLRQSPRWKRNYKISTANQIKWQLVKAGVMPKEPFKKARIRVVRHSPGRPDYDGLVGGFKEILDCLTTPVYRKGGSIKNKYGIGLIVDDGPDFVSVEYVAVKCRGVSACTLITIECASSDCVFFVAGGE